MQRTIELSATVTSGKNDDGQGDLTGPEDVTTVFTVPGRHLANTLTAIAIETVGMRRR